MSLRAARIAFGIAALTATVLAQAPAERLAFEVASIKANESGSLNGGGGPRPGGLYKVTNLSIDALLPIAYGGERILLPSQIVGAPSWLSTARFDITARMPQEHINASSQELNAMMRSLLEDRFKLSAHMEKRQTPIYTLVKARADGRLGPGLHETGVDCLALSQRRRDDPSVPRPDICAKGFIPQPGHITGGLNASTLAEILTNAAQRVVVDRTGLTGTLQVDLQWSPNITTTSDTDAVSIFAAVQEQLGLKLEPSSGPADVFVIDHIEKPTED